MQYSRLYGHGGGGLTGVLIVRHDLRPAAVSPAGLWINGRRGIDPGPACRKPDRANCSRHVSPQQA
jgi:hypothetical protein